MSKFFKELLVLRVKSSGDVFVVILGRFFPDVKGTIKDGLLNTIPEETRTTISPGVVVPTPEGVLREVGNASGWILLFEEVEEFSVFLRRRLAHGRGDEVTRKSGRRVDEKKEGEGEGGGDVSESIVEERKNVEDEDGADGEKDRETKTERKRELSKRRTKKFTNEGDEVEKEVTTKEKKDTGDGAEY